MEPAVKKVLTVIVFILLLSLMIGLVTSLDFLKDSPFIIVLIVVLMVIFIPVLLSSKTSQVYDKTKETISSKVDDLKTNSKIKEDLNVYNNAKNSLQYLSNDTLLDKYNSYLSTKTEDMNRLALEEELVKRKLIPFSPMHEKLEKIKSNFNM